MIDEIVEKAKNNQNGSFKGNQFKKVVSGSPDPDTTMGVAKSNQGKRNDITSGSADPEVEKGNSPVTILGL